MVAQFKVFNDGQRGKRFTQAYAVGQNAAVVRADLLHRTFDTIFLELKKGLPDFGVSDSRVVKELGSRVRQLFAPHHPNRQ